MGQFLMLMVLLGGIELFAADGGQAPPQIPFRVVPKFLKIPDNYLFNEAVGVAVNSKGHIFIANRGNHPFLEFAADGSFVRSFGEGSPLFKAPHSVRFDAQDNMWYVDAEYDLIIKFDANRRIREVLGRRPEPWVWMTHGIERALAPPQNFYQPTDTAIGPDGSIYISDGYGNSRVAKFSKDGIYLKQWGDRGTGQGQFNTPHSIVIDHNATLYVADRQNSRVQVFDTDGNFKSEWRLAGNPWSLCITPGPNQVIYAGSVTRVFKLSLDGKVLGEFGKGGKAPGEFDSVHALACPDEKTLYVSQEWSYRFDKIELLDGSKESTR